MHWADTIAKEIIDSKKYRPYWVDDMKTPSGRIHVGSLRGVVIHGLIYLALLDQGAKSEFTYVFDNHDPMDEISADLDKNKWHDHLGKPLFLVPSPDKKAKNYAEFFAEEFVAVFNKIGFFPKLIWASDLYTSGKMNKGIKLCLDNAGKIRDIYAKLYKKPIEPDWFPFQIVCPECGKEATTKVFEWDGERVSFKCDKNGANYAIGCGYSGIASPFSGEGKYAGKLPWKIEWAVKWQAIGVTVEGAGKDHMVDGGSHDVASQICKKVIKYPVPYPFTYEFFLLGGKKMSSSKGLGSSAQTVSEILPPELLRFLFVRTDYKKAIEFDPLNSVVIPDLFDEYDRIWQAYISNSNDLLSRIFVLSQVKDVPPIEPTFLPRFRDVATYIQLSSVDLGEKFNEIKGSPLTQLESGILQERKKYAQLWIDKYAPEDYRLQMLETLPENVKNLTPDQKLFLIKVSELLQHETDPEELQLKLYNLAKEIKIVSTDAFRAIYQSFIGKDHGPKAAWFLLQYPKDKVINRLHEAGK